MTSGPNRDWDDAMRQAQSTLSDLVTGKFATLAVPAPKYDRHGRLRAQVGVSGEWLQEAMLREGLAWISGHPLDFARLSGERMAEFWFPASHYLWHATGVTLVAVLAFAGWVVAWSNARPAAWILMAVPLSYSLTFLLIEACIRYTYPIAWSLLLAAGALTASRLDTGEGRYLVR